jgi:hypothetical protein
MNQHAFSVIDQASLGLVPDQSIFTLFFRDMDIDTANPNKFAGDSITTYTFNTSAATMYVSSTSASDVGNLIIVQGLDENWDAITGIAATNGQNQVEIVSAVDASAITFIRVNFCINISPTSLLGSVWVAESDTLSGGAPTTESAKKFLIPFDSDAGRSHNIGTYGVLSIPNGFSAHLFDVTASSSVKNQPVNVTYNLNPFGQAPLKLNDFIVGNEVFNLNQNSKTIQIESKWDIYLTLTSGQNNSKANGIFVFRLFKNSTWGIT